MALVKLLRGGQVTMPARIRRELRVEEGDYFEAELVEGGVLLKPVSVAEREQAWQRLLSIVERPKWRGPGPEPSEDEVMEMAVEAVHEVRRDRAKSGSRQLGPGERVPLTER